MSKFFVVVMEKKWQEFKVYYPRHPHHHVSHAKILTHTNFMDLRHPRQNFDPRHPRHFFLTTSKFYGPTPPTPPTPFFWPTPKFYRPMPSTPPTLKFEPRHAQTHAPTLPTPSTLFSRLFQQWQKFGES